MISFHQSTPLGKPLEHASSYLDKPVVQVFYTTLTKVDLALYELFLAKFCVNW